MKNTLLFFFILLCLSCTDKEYEIIEDSPKTLLEVRKDGLFEYNKIDNNKVFFSNIKPDYLVEDRKDYPLGRLRNYNDKNGDVIKYFDKKLKSKFVYYYFRNDSLVSRLYLIDNGIKTEDKGKITNITIFKKVMDSLKINYCENCISKEILHKVYSFKKPITDDVFLINNKYPAIIHASEKIFFVEVLYNRLDNNSIWMLEK